MYNQIQRDGAYKSRLCDFIGREYGLKAVSLTEAKRGFYGETWRLETPDGAYFIKLDCSERHKFVFRDGIAVSGHLRRNGIDFIPKVIKTAGGALSACYETAIMGVFEWIGGENIQNRETKIKEYRMLSKIYTVSPEGVALPRENFGTDCADCFYSYRERLKTLTDEGDAARLLRLFDKNAGFIEHNAARLALFAERCGAEHGHFYITHGDAGGNVIIDGDKAYIVDWDESKSAPPERDAWFCMHWSWATDAFRQALRQNGVGYILKPERLAYYCYSYFFYYLNEYIAAFLSLPDKRGALADSVGEYFSCWINDNLRFADGIL